MLNIIYGKRHILASEHIGVLSLSGSTIQTGTPNTLYLINGQPCYGLSYLIDDHNDRLAFSIGSTEYEATLTHGSIDLTTIESDLNAVVSGWTIENTAGYIRFSHTSQFSLLPHRPWSLLPDLGFEPEATALSTANHPYTKCPSRNPARILYTILTDRDEACNLNSFQTIEQHCDSTIDAISLMYPMESVVQKTDLFSTTGTLTMDNRDIIIQPSDDNHYIESGGSITWLFEKQTRLSCIELNKSDYTSIGYVEYLSGSVWYTVAVGIGERYYMTLPTEVDGIRFRNITSTQVCKINGVSKYVAIVNDIIFYKYANDQSQYYCDTVNEDIEDILASFNGVLYKNNNTWYLDCLRDKAASGFDDANVLSDTWTHRYEPLYSRYIATFNDEELSGLESQVIRRLEGVAGLTKSVTYPTVTRRFQVELLLDLLIKQNRYMQPVYSFRMNGAYSAPNVYDRITIGSVDYIVTSISLGAVQHTIECILYDSDLFRVTIPDKLQRWAGEPLLTLDSLSTTEQALFDQYISEIIWYKPSLPTSVSEFTLTGKSAILLTSGNSALMHKSSESDTTWQWDQQGDKIVFNGFTVDDDWDLRIACIGVNE